MRFPRGRAELPDEVVAHVAGQMKVPAGEFDSYQWTGSTIKYHRGRIREHLGFRVCSIQDAEKLTAWLVANVAYAERRPDRVREELLQHCGEECIEPVAAGRNTRMVRSACAPRRRRVSRVSPPGCRLPTEVRARVLAQTRPPCPLRPDARDNRRLPRRPWRPALPRGTVYDPADLMGEMFFNIRASLAEFEVDLLRLRSREGAAVAWAEGKLKCKQPKPVTRRHAHLAEQHATGQHSIADLAEQFSFSRATVYRVLERARTTT
ncbi:DUF4158 domain-containing protein [Streptomyces atratus]|uniref:DUF4158 domain-containing protein n=1 Tax=Streptomyces atratus TaxID=1893 RepID=UPI0033EBF449